MLFKLLISNNESDLLLSHLHTFYYLKKENRLLIGDLPESIQKETQKHLEDSIDKFDSMKSFDKATLWNNAIKRIKTNGGLEAITP